MAGHSKWANTRFRKAAQDQKRGKLFTKFIREITIATKQAGPDPNLNPRLRSAIDKALTGNLTKDAIDRAIKRATGGDNKDLTEVCYEGYAPMGIAIMVECLTDNHTRTIANIRHFFNKQGGSLGVTGSVSYLFNKTGQIFLPTELNLTANQVDQIMETAINHGALDLDLRSEGILITTNPKDLTNITEILENLLKQKIEHSEINMVANNYIKLNNLTDAMKIANFLEQLEELDDVEAVYTNADLSELDQDH